MTKHLAALGLCIVGGWLLAVVILFLLVQFSDGKVFDSTWLSTSI